MADRPEGLSRVGDKLVLAACVVLAVWMMSWEESTRVRRGAEWLHRLVTPIEWVDRLVDDVIALKRENEELRGQLAALRLDAQQIEHERARFEELRLRAGFHERNRGRLVPAEVIELVVSRIPVQAKVRSFGGDSLAVWQPVVSERGLVGRVRQVLEPNLALVQLLTEEDSRISVEVVRTGVTGLLRYDGRRFFVDHVPQGEPVVAGDEMITSGLGGTVPRGIAVGAVVAVRSSPSELFQQVEVESRVEFSALRDVYVITRPGPWYARAFSADAADSAATDAGGAAGSDSMAGEQDGTSEPGARG